MTSTFRLFLNQGNDEQVELPFMSQDAVWAIPPGTEIDFFIKSQASTPDTDPSTKKLSTVTGDIQIQDPTTGVAVLTIPHTALTAAGLFWWRCDAVISGSRKTGGYGPLEVKAM